MRILTRIPALAWAAAVLLLAACAPSRPPPREDVPPPPDSDPAPLRAIYLVHGDGDHVWHDSSGARRFADREALRQAHEASAKTAGESFIFHLKARATFFGKRSDGEWFHYRDGELLAKGAYSMRRGDSAFAAEARVLRGRGGTTKGSRTFLAWFSHEIADARRLEGRGIFGISSFAGGLSRLQPGTDSTKAYALIVLSVCYGGSPAMLRALAPLADHVVASPAYLHLSHLDVGAFADSMAADTSADGAARLADSVAARSFVRLGRTTSTEVTVATYDIDRVVPFLLRADSVGIEPRAARPAAWADCAEQPGFNEELAKEGTRLHYRPPRFGPGKERLVRSAWQCAF